MPEHLVYGWFQKEWLAEAERRSKSDASVRDTRCVDSEPRPVLPRVGEMCFVQLGRRNGTEPICTDRLNFGRAFDPVCSCSVGWNVERLIWVLRPIEVVRSGNLVIRVQVVVNASKRGCV